MFASGPDEGFLDLAGWNDGAGVTPSTGNHFANLDEIARLYNSDQFLKDSRFWYHAETFDASRLRLLMAGNSAPPQFKELFPTLFKPEILGEPLLLCYYLFFPGHDEPLEDCARVAEAAMFGSYAGEWACIAILLKCKVTEVTLGGEPVKEECLPVAIGLTSRNVGDIGFLGGERRVGMRIFEWPAVQQVTRDRGPGKLQGIHPRLFVAKGTHGLYLHAALDQESEGGLRGVPVEPFAPEDSARQHCGQAELLGKSLEDLDDEAEEAADDVWVDDSEVVWTKILLFPLGFLWSGIEWIAGGGGGMNLPGSRTPAQFDHPPDRDGWPSFSVIVHPVSVDPPNSKPPIGREDGPQKFAWRSPLELVAAPDEVADIRIYSMIVDRVSQAAPPRQIWWPGIHGQTGYSGRWGPRVARDPNARRAGMKFPEFWEMFISAFAKSKALL